MKFKKIAIALFLTGCSTQPVSELPPAYTKPAAQNQVSNQNYEAPAPIVAEDFNKWLAGFKAKALKSGISQQTVNSTLTNLQPEEKVVTFDHKQPEVTQTKEEYLKNVISDARIQKGRELMVENQAVLKDISAKTGVEPQYIVALWGLETGYGKNTGKYSIISSLATLAYEGRRREFFESELLSALLIIDEGHATASDLRGSWAGAMGQCQFMPSSYLAYAVDYDNDGRIDIWNDKGDVLASIANYLSTVGWGKDQAAKEKALMHWNHSSYFVASVVELADDIK